ncbi:MAG: hypothetical protein VX252_00940 [Myxococcota bacterium]|nr:hypothetical protein [Myxococcota bacterium]
MPALRAGWTGRMDIRFLLLQVCFFLSGFAALLYETAWTREFAFVFGTSELAVSAVLAAYMAGLALGAAVAARFAPRVSRPILAYGVIELGIAVGALLVPFAIRALMSVYVGWLGGLGDVPEEVSLFSALFHLAGSFIILIPCTALMGATLPLLARHAVRSEDQIGPRIGLLYSVNTVGAIGGALTAAFLLLPELGLRRTIYVGAGLNVLVFLAAAALARVAAPRPDQSAKQSRGPFLILPLIAISGMVSFIYEVLWVRLLGYVLGGSTAAFATMLASFLLGIALGSALAAPFAKRTANASTGFALVQVGIAIFAISTFSLTGFLPDWARALGASPEALLPGAVLSVLILLPVTICVGATFPFAVRILAQDADDAASASARVYAWNTLGSIVGSVGAGFFLLPWLGFHGTVFLGSVLNVGLAVAASWWLLRGRSSWVLIGLTLVVGATLIFFRPGPPSQILVTNSLTGTPTPGELAYVGVGRSGTVSLIRTPYAWRVVTSGLPESAMQLPAVPPDQFRESRWLSILPVMLRPDAERMLIIGLGGGNTLAAVPSTVEKIELIELEAEVVEANRRVGDARRGGDPLKDPRLHLRLGDARGSMILTDAEYDAIVSQPSHPWTSGASHLYTREFFEMARSRLAPGGVFVQWMGLSFVDDGLLRGLIGTLDEVFENVAVFRPRGGGAIIFAASDEPFDVRESVLQAASRIPDDMSEIGVYTPEDVLASLVLDPAAATRFSEGAEPISDDWNRLAWIKQGRVPKEGVKGSISEALLESDPLQKADSQIDPDLLASRLLVGHNAHRIDVWADTLSGPDRERVLGWQQLYMGRKKSAQQHFERALEEDPDSARARVGLELAVPDSIEIDELPRQEALFVRANRLARAADWDALSELDSQLALWPRGALFYPEVQRLRVSWRVQDRTPARAEEAIQILDPLIVMGGSVNDLMNRAEAAAAAGRVDYAWATLDRILQRIRAASRPRVTLRRALDLARRLPAREGSAKTRAVLESFARQSR